MQNTNTLKNVVNFNSAENSVQLYIDLAHKNLTVNNSKIESITMYADAECAGDLAVNWEEEDDSNYVHNSSMLMRDNAIQIATHKQCRNFTGKMHLQTHLTTYCLKTDLASKQLQTLVQVNGGCRMQDVQAMMHLKLLQKC